MRRASRRGVTGRTARRALWLGASFLLVFALWEWAGRWPISPAFPPFSRTVAALGRMALDGALARAYAETLRPLLLGVAVSAACGIAAGVGMGLSRTVEWLALPVLVIAQAAPMAAIIPLITYVYGIGLTAKVLAVVVLAVPVIAMNSYKGIRHTSPSLLEMCRAFLGTRRQAVLKIVLPHAAGLIFAGLRLGVAMGFIGVVIAELLITPTGVGDLITYHSSVADYPEMFAAIASIIALGALTIHALQRVERRLFPPEIRGS
jgi:ABC-type nitrate/sulfonate/bicarbonate transport system permease component